MSEMLEVTNVFMARILKVQITLRNWAIQLKHNNEAENTDGLMFKIFEDVQLSFQRIICNYANQNFTILKLYHAHLRATNPTAENENFQSVCLRTIKHVVPEFNRSLLIHCRTWGCSVNDYIDKFKDLLKLIIEGLMEFNKILHVLDEDLTFHYAQCCKNLSTSTISMPKLISCEYRQDLLNMLQKTIDIFSEPQESVNFIKKLELKFESMYKMKPLDTYLWYFLQNDPRLYEQNVKDDKKDDETRPQISEEDLTKPQDIINNYSESSNDSSNSDSCINKVSKKSKCISRKKVKKFKLVNLDLNEKPINNKSIRLIYYSRSRCYICLELQFNFNFTMSTDCQHFFCK